LGHFVGQNFQYWAVLCNPLPGLSFTDSWKRCTS